MVFNQILANIAFSHAYEYETPCSPDETPVASDAEEEDDGHAPWALMPINQPWVLPPLPTLVAQIFNDDTSDDLDFEALLIKLLS